MGVKKDTDALVSDLQGADGRCRVGPVHDLHALQQHVELQEVGLTLIQVFEEKER